MGLLYRCLMDARAATGEVDPPPLTCLDSTTGGRTLEVAASCALGSFFAPAARVSSLRARGSLASLQHSEAASSPLHALCVA